MLVKDWMTKEVITLEENESILKAAQILKKYKIRRIPITKNGKLVGIVTNTDINAVAPSKLTPLDVHELYSFLAEIKVKEVMTKNPLTVKPDNTVEYAAILMLENKISGLPVVNEHNYVVGIITQTDIFKLLIEISGVYRSSYHLCLRIKKSEDIPIIFDLFKSLKITIHSMFIWEEPKEDRNKFFIFIRLEEKEKGQVENLLRELKKRFELLYFLKEDLENIPHKLEENEDLELLLI